MCGIALLVSGVRLDLSSNSTDIHSPSLEQNSFTVDDLRACLERRGPDSIGSKNIFIYPKSSSALEEELVLSHTNGEGHTRNCVCSTSEDNNLDNKHLGLLHLIGATLQLRGKKPIAQPLEDSSGNILVYNGEIFGGLHVGHGKNDAEILMKSLEMCCSCNSDEHERLCSNSGTVKISVPELLSKIKGPWGLIYWQNTSKTLWFGRDAFGRRSLLVHWPTSKDSRFLLSSVSPLSTVLESPDDTETNEMNFWEELACGIYSMSMCVSEHDGRLAGKAKKYGWTNPLLKDLIEWERTCIDPKSHLVKMPSDSGRAQAVLLSLRESVIRRSSLDSVYQTGTCDYKTVGSAPVAVLFSGGLDSMILAALLDECLDRKYEIDLLNVSFDGQSAPDRISARAGVKELARTAPLRRWKLVEIDADLSKLIVETKHVMSLINPAKTYMDLNIGLALWLAAGGDGRLCEEHTKNNHASHNNSDGGIQQVRYKSEARILLVGSGADEQCAGYGRHKTKYREGSWVRLHEEMKLDMQRIWKRNLGRDDRCISDNGKEARFPFLDEDVIKTLLDISLWEIADLDLPSGTGDKKILREVARMLGLHEAAVLPKRAIQFGSRIARESNRKNFGSNRAANQASAGNVNIHKL
jgi:asparagine synthetase B (glutamine-hydrolysing)